MDTVEYILKQRRYRLDCMDAHADLSGPCCVWCKGPFIALCINCIVQATGKQSTVEPRYLELAYFELPLISKWKSGPCFNMKLWQQVTK